MTTIIDTDSLIALITEADTLHQRSSTLQQRLADENATVYLLTSTLGEFVSTCANKIGVASTQKAVETFHSTYTISHINDDILHTALPLYYKQTSIENSL